ncbi:MAG: DUF5050 domain-containing protein [Oscillospiraceae bacterium]|jgi:hypothetical protein|nr:DUF5050 domain-containing protein [Oscillospiraceae bacterium]
MKRRLPGILLALALLLALPGCGQPQPPAESGEAALLFLEGYVYFTFGGALYCETPEFSQQTRLVQSGATAVFYHNGHLGYVDASNGGKLNWMLFDGSNAETVADVAAAQPVATGAWIYFINQSDKSRVYRVNPATGAQEPLTSESCVSFDVAGETLYYSTGQALFSLALGGAAEQLAKGRGVGSVFAGAKLREDGSALVEVAQMVYFVQDNRLFKLSSAGGTPEQVGRAVGESWCLRGEDAYCTAEGKLLRQPLGGGDAVQLAEGCTAVAGAGGGWVYFVAEAEGKQQFVRIRREAGKQEVLVQGQ